MSCAGRPLRLSPKLADWCADHALGVERQRGRHIAQPQQRHIPRQPQAAILARQAEPAAIGGPAAPGAGIVIADGQRLGLDAAQAFKARIRQRRVDLRDQRRNIRHLGTGGKHVSERQPDLAVLVAAQAHAGPGEAHPAKLQLAAQQRPRVEPRAQIGQHRHRDARAGAQIHVRQHHPRQPVARHQNRHVAEIDGQPRQRRAEPVLDALAQPVGGRQRPPHQHQRGDPGNQRQHRQRGARLGDPAQDPAPRAGGWRGRFRRLVVFGGHWRSGPLLCFVLPAFYTEARE